MSCLAGYHPRAEVRPWLQRCPPPASQAAAELVQLKQSSSCAGWNKHSMWAILASLHVNPARGWASERMFVVFCRCFLRFINVLSCFFLLQLGPKHLLRWLTHLVVSPSFACSAGYAIQNTDVSQLEKPSRLLLWFAAEVRQKGSWLEASTILVWKWVPPLLLLELDSVIRVQKNRREEVYELFRIFQSMEKKQLCHFLDISSYTKGLNTCICVCVCVCEIQQSKYDVI